MFIGQLLELKRNENFAHKRGYDGTVNFHTDSPVIYWLLVLAFTCSLNREGFNGYYGADPERAQGLNHLSKRVSMRAL